MADCQVCKLQNVETRQAAPGVPGVAWYVCARCGEYRLTREVRDALDALDVTRRPRLSRWIREQNRLGSAPTIFEADIATIAGIPPLDFAIKAERVLEYMVERTKGFGQRFGLGELPELQSFAETFSANDLGFIGKYPVERGFAEDKSLNYSFSVTGHGFERIEEVRKSNASSSQAFVAMWFNEELEGAWKEGLREGVQRAGYVPLRIDGKQHNHKICDEIVAEIRRSSFVVADFTGQRGGVYYEAGFAAGLGIPVIFTCRKDHLKDLHFDIRQFNTIDWTDPAELATRLSERISATIGDGPGRAAPQRALGTSPLTAE
jgi:nucleoside 2-deoxyribosyltransferase